MPHAFCASHPSVSFTSFAAHVKHHVLSESIPFPFGLYVCLPLSCLDVKCTLDMNPLSSPALLPSLPTQVPHRPIINAEPSLFCQSVGHLVVKLTLLRRWTISSGWLLAESGIQTSRIDNVTPENGPPSPRPENHPVHLPHNQTRSLHRVSAELIFREKCQFVLDGQKWRARAFEGS